MTWDESSHGAWYALAPSGYVEKRREFPEFRRWLGDSPVLYINLVSPNAEWHERSHVAGLFPEAFIVPELPD